jgi:hypothetical protein
MGFVFNYNEFVTSPETHIVVLVLFLLKREQNDFQLLQVVNNVVKKNFVNPNCNDLKKIFIFFFERQKNIIIYKRRGNKEWRKVQEVLDPLK